MFTFNSMRVAIARWPYGLAVLALGMVISSCSDDNPTGSDPAVPGDPNDPEYSAVDRVLGAEALAFEGLHWHGLLEGEIPGAVSARRREATPAHDTLLSITVTVDSATGWIVLEARVANHHDTADILDSVRFYSNGVPTIPSDDFPPDSMDAIDVYITGQLSVNDTTDFVGQGTHASRIHLAVLDRDPGLATITYELNLTADDSIDGTAYDSVWGVCDLHVAAHRAVTDLIEVEELTPSPVSARLETRNVWEALAAHEGCPLAGSVLLEMDVDLHCTGGEAELVIDSEWKVEATFLGGDEVQVTFTSGGFYWSKVVDCAELDEL